MRDKSTTSSIRNIDEKERILLITDGLIINMMERENDLDEVTNDIFKKIEEKIFDIHDVLENTEPDTLKAFIEPLESILDILRASSDDNLSSTEIDKISNILDEGLILEYHSPLRI